MHQKRTTSPLLWGDGRVYRVYIGSLLLTEVSRNIELTRMRILSSRLCVRRLPCFSGLAALLRKTFDHVDWVAVCYLHFVCVSWSAVRRVERAKVIGATVELHYSAKYLFPLHTSEHTVSHSVRSENSILCPTVAEMNAEYTWEICHQISERRTFKISSTSSVKLLSLTWKIAGDHRSLSSSLTIQGKLLVAVATPRIQRTY